MVRPPVRFAAALLFAACCGTQAAKAVEFRGSFAGTARNSFMGMYPNDPSSTHFDRAIITGTFDLISTSAAIISPIPTNYVASLLLGESRLTFDLFGKTYVYDVKAPGRIAAANLQTGAGVAPGEQAVTIFSQMIPGNDYTDAGLALVGPDFFDFTNPLSLHPGTVDLAASNSSDTGSANMFYNFGSRFRFGTGILLTSVTFEPTTVPEASGLSVIGFAMAALALARVGRYRAVMR